VSSRRFAIFGLAPSVLVLEASSAISICLAQQWTVALGPDSYQAGRDQQFKFVKGILLPRTLPDLISRPAFGDSHPCSRRGSTHHAIEMPTVGDAFELVLAGVFEHESRASRQILYRG
jgi:hypothetical protein